MDSSWAYWVKAKTGQTARAPEDYLSNFYQPSSCLQVPQNKVIIIMPLTAVSAASNWVNNTISADSCPEELRSDSASSWWAQEFTLNI